MVVIVTGGSNCLLCVSLTKIQPMLVAIRVMLFTLYTGCQDAVIAYSIESTMQGKYSNMGAPSSPLLMA